MPTTLDATRLFFVVSETLIIILASNKYLSEYWISICIDSWNGGIETWLRTVLERAREGNEWSNDVMWVLFITNPLHSAHAHAHARINPTPRPLAHPHNHSPSNQHRTTRKKGKKKKDKMLNILGNYDKDNFANYITENYYFTKYFIVANILPPVSFAWVSGITEEMKPQFRLHYKTQSLEKLQHTYTNIHTESTTNNYSYTYKSMSMHVLIKHITHRNA